MDLREAIRAAGLGGGGGWGNTGQNPPNGAVLDFHFQEIPEGEVRLEIHTDQGELVRAYSTEADTEAGEGRLSVEAGMNRHLWDLRYPPVFRVPELYVFGSLQGRRVTPGTYTVRLSTGEEEQTAEIRVSGDPRLDTTRAQYRAQDELAKQIATETEALHRAVVRLGKAREQIQGILDRVEDLREPTASWPEAPPKTRRSTLAMPRTSSATVDSTLLPISARSKRLPLPRH